MDRKLQVRLSLLVLYQGCGDSVYVCTSVSKSAQKNRRKKQHQQPVTSGRSQEQRDAVSMATHLMGVAGSEGVSGGGGDKEKKIRNLKKVGENIFCGLR